MKKGKERTRPKTAERRHHIPEILNRGSLLTYRDHGTERCFGYLMDFRGHGIYEPTFGKLEVTPQEAKMHNELLSHAEIEGLDNNCAIGVGGMFYTKKAGTHTIVVTWLGDEVSQDVQIKNNVLTFQRHAMTFRGQLHEEEDCFVFKRIASPTPAGSRKEP